MKCHLSQTIQRTQKGASVNTYWEIDQQDVTFWLLKKVNVGNKESELSSRVGTVDQEVRWVPDSRQKLLQRIGRIWKEACKKYSKVVCSLDDCFSRSKIRPGQVGQYPACSRLQLVKSAEATEAVRLRPGQAHPLPSQVTTRNHFNVFFFSLCAGENWRRSGCQGRRPAAGAAGVKRGCWRERAGSLTG